MVENKHAKKQWQVSKKTTRYRMLISPGLQPKNSYLKDAEAVHHWESFVNVAECTFITT